ncbi:MAG: hypothetical protein M3548_00325 [Actinomycetota bacterium]|nr:hypothetical protein [Actinomycetota bacterium]
MSIRDLTKQLDSVLSKIDSALSALNSAAGSLDEANMVMTFAVSGSNAPIVAETLGGLQNTQGVVRAQWEALTRAADVGRR